MNKNSYVSQWNEESSWIFPERNKKTPQPYIAIWPDLFARTKPLVLITAIDSWAASSSWNVSKAGIYKIFS